jgi:hypothetical protein
MRNLFLIPLVLLTFCSEENGPPVVKFQPIDDLSEIRLSATESTDPDNDPLTFKWSSDNPRLFIKNAYAAEATLVIPDGSEDYTTDIHLTVSDGKTSQSLVKWITIPALTEQRKFGLGKIVAYERSNDVPYSWYFDQQLSGQFANVNCGPTSVTMAIKWTSPDFDRTPEDARGAYRPGGGWWFTNDIMNYLNDNGTTNWFISLSSMGDIRTEIDNGNIVILCLDMYHVSAGTKPNYHVDKFYDASTTGWGHFIVVKGYKEVDGHLFFETYDPNSYGAIYENSVLKGRDRYYRSEDLDKATQLWWDYAIIVSKSVNGRKNTSKAVTPTRHALGR